MPPTTNLNETEQILQQGCVCGHAGVTALSVAQVTHLDKDTHGRLAVVAHP